MKHRPFKLIRLPGLNGRRNWYRGNVPGVEISAQMHFDFVWLSQIRVTDKRKRSKGLGTWVMRELIAWADAHQKGVRLLAEADDKRDQKRLEAWYRSLGFLFVHETHEFIYAG